MAVTLTLSVGLVIVSLGVVTTMIVISQVVVAPVSISMIITGRGLELGVSQVGGDIHSLTETITKSLPETVV